MRIGYEEAERMKVWRLGLKIDFQEARENFEPTILVGVKRFISIPNKAERDYLKKIGYKEDEIEEIGRQAQRTLGFFFKVKEKLKDLAINVFNIKVEKEEAEIFEYFKLRSHTDVPRFVRLLAKACGWLYIMNEPEKNAWKMERVLKEAVRDGFWSGVGHYKHHREKGGVKDMVDENETDETEQEE